MNRTIYGGCSCWRRRRVGWTRRHGYKGTSDMAFPMPGTTEMGSVHGLAAWTSPSMGLGLDMTLFW